MDTPSEAQRHWGSVRDYLIADGATGTNLFAMGLQSGDAPELWNVDHPNRIRALYDGFVEAGSDLFLTNTFGGSPLRLAPHGLDELVEGGAPAVVEAHLVVLRAVLGIGVLHEGAVARAGTGGLVLPAMCVDGPAVGGAGIYQVTIVWRGSASMTDSVNNACGALSGNYGAGNEFRRIMQIPTFIDPTI